ncbi:MAG: hypothetical protein KC415_10115, partial [Anaerolineales bacterium]|nr:hypothetical protein [Anaerolineales bacterium]
YPLALPFGLIFSIGVHNWYPHIFPPALGYFLIVAVGSFYAGMLQLGVWLTHRLPKSLKLFALPVAWTAVEFLKFIAPVINDWWFVLLAKSQWQFPPALQILSITGFPGLSFLVMLVNVVLAFGVLAVVSGQYSVFSKQFSVEDKLNTDYRLLITVLTAVALILIWGARSMGDAPAETFTIAALTDMVNQDPAIQAKSEFSGEDVGYVADSAEMSQAIFDVDADLTRQVDADFYVWSENEFANADDPVFAAQLQALAAEMDAAIVTDMVWNAVTGMHDTAVLTTSSGENGRRAKINITSGEAEHGFAPGPNEFPVFDTPQGKVGIGVCWDVHRLWIVRELARSGAKIVLLPMDNDFGGTATFPPFHGSDGVFRAVENRVAMGLGTVNGLSLVVDPYGRIIAQAPINQRSIIVGETFTAPGQTLYTRWGDWFGWLMVAALVVLVSVAIRRKG